MLGLSNKTNVEIPKFSLIERLAGIYQPFDNYFRATGVQNLVQRGIWPGDDNVQVDPAPVPPQAVPHQNRNKGKIDNPCSKLQLKLI